MHRSDAKYNIGHVHYRNTKQGFHCLSRALVFTFIVCVCLVVQTDNILCANWDNARMYR